MKRVRDLHLSKSRARSYYGLMGHTLCEVAQVHLTHGIHTYYPSLALDRNPSERFAVIPWPRCKNEFIVTDIDLMIYAELSREQLENTSFDIVGWYIDILKNRSLYPFSAKAEKDESCCRDSHVYVGCSHPEDDNLSHGSDNEHAEEDTYDELLEQQTVSDGGYENYRTLEYFENLPHFHSLLRDEDSDDEEGITDYVSDDDCASDNSEEHVRIEDLPAEILAVRLAEVLTSCQPYPGDGPAIDATYIQEESRFIFARHHPDIIEIYDRVQGFETHISLDVLRNETFRPGLWFAERCAYHMNLPQPWREAQSWMESRSGTTMWMFDPDEEADSEVFTREMTKDEELELGGVQVDRNKYPSLQRNSANVKGHNRILPKPVVVKLEVNGHPVRALLDSGSLGDFVSSTLVDQLAIKRDTLDPPLSLHLAVQGS